MTLPAEWPEWVDTDYIAPAVIPPRPQPQAARHLHETLAELHARHGPTWGIRQMTDARPRTALPKPPTDEELRARYPASLGGGTAHAKKDREAVPQPPGPSDEPLAF